MTDDKITIVIPVHNGEKHINKTVNNILNQSYKNIEVILVVNFSSDRSLEICKKLEISNDKVMFLECKEPGTNYARKMGVDYASGKYVTFCDQDDSYYTLNALEEMHAAIVNSKAQICQFGYYKKRYGKVSGISLTENIQIFSRKQLMQTQIKGIRSARSTCFRVQVWNKMYTTELLKQSYSIYSTDKIPPPLFC